MVTRFEVPDLNSAELKVHELIQKGENYRNIAKTEFVINGSVKHFNPSQISQIKTKLESKPEKNQNDPNKAKVFRLFQNGKSPTDVLIETKFSYEFVNQSHNEFLEFEDKVSIPRWFEEKIFELTYDIQQGPGLNGVYKALKLAVDSHVELQEHYFFCSKCDEQIPIDNRTLEDARNYLSNKWHHAEC